MEQFKLPDPKKTSGKVLKFLLFGGIALIAGKYLLPVINQVVDGTIDLAWGALELGIAVVSLAVFLLIFTSKKFWRRLNIILEALGSGLFGIFVEMNTWNILYNQVDEMEEDRRLLGKEKEKLQAQDSSLSSQLQEEKTTMQEAEERANIVRGRLKLMESTHPEYEVLGLELESATNDYVSSKDFIDSVAPISGDIKRLIAFADKGYIKAEYVIKDARTRIKKLKAADDAVRAGAGAMSKLSDIFFGDPEMNKASAIAQNKIKADIAMRRGIIKNSIVETSKFMNDRDLRDAAKVSLAVKNMESLKIEEGLTINYVDSQREMSTLPKTQSNKWLNELKN